MEHGYIGKNFKQFIKIWRRRRTGIDTLSKSLEFIKSD